MLKEGYQPDKDKLDKLNPPKGGSGVSDQNILTEIRIIPKLKKGDIVIVKMKEDITAGLAQRLVDQLTKVFPDNKSIVLCAGRDLYPLPKEILNDMGWYQRKKPK